MPGGSGPWVTIVGVAGNLQETIVYKEMGYEYFVYHPMTQSAPATMVLFVRFVNNAGDLASVIRREAKALDSRIPAINIESMDDVLSQDHNISQARFRTIMLGTFAMLSLALAAIGLYGVFTQTVLQRTHEIGVRVALGAQSSDILRFVVTRALLLSGQESWQDLPLRHI